MTLNLVKEIASRMKDPDVLREQVLSSPRSSSVHSVSWSALTLSHGYPGVLVLFAALDELYPEEKWDLISHAYVIKIKETIETEGISDLSMFGGLSGVCFAIQQASKNKTRYQKLLTNLNMYLFDKAKTVFLDPLQEKFDLALPIYPSVYDVMSGVCGLGAYTLSQLDCPLSLGVLKKLLEACINLTKDIKVGPYTLPGWYVPRHYQFIEIDKEIYKKGNFNLGIAHGIPGVLSFLSLAAIEGVILENQLEAIKKISDWLYSKKRSLNEIPYWDYRLSFEEDILGIPETKTQISMDGWCYGTAGVLRSLYLAGKAIKDKELQQNAIKDFLPISQRLILNQPFTSSFCHGLAGLLTLTHLMARDSKSIELSLIKDKMATDLINFYRNEHFFGFKDVEVSFLNNDKKQHVSEFNKVGLLDGVSGILLALVGYHTKVFSWTLPFLLGGK